VAPEKARIANDEPEGDAPEAAVPGVSVLPRSGDEG
jgi:hypothetical protein